MVQDFSHPWDVQQPCGFPSQQPINFCISHVHMVLSNYLMFMNCFSYIIQIFRHPTFIAAMGNSPSATEGCQSVATTSNMDANYQYSGQEWIWPSTLLILRILIGGPSNVPLMDAQAGFIWWKPRNHNTFGRCHHCNKRTWVESFFQLGSP